MRTGWKRCPATKAVSQLNDARREAGFRRILTLALLTGTIAATSTLHADDGSADKPKPYPLNTCAVSSEKLGGMGKFHVFVHEGREIKLCCQGCLKDFQNEPAKFIKKIDAAKNDKNKAAGHHGHSSQNHQH